MIAGREQLFSADVSNSNDTPIYLQLVTSIKGLISEGILREGDLLPSEIEFCDYYKISRTTVRQTFAVLEREGLLTRIRGKGTFVATPKLTRSLNGLHSFSGELSNIGLSTDSEVLSFDIIKATKDLCELFDFANITKKEVFQIVRLRTANNEPLTIETLYIPVFICPELSKERMEHQSLYSLLKQYANIIPVHAVETYSATTIRSNESTLLKTPTGTGAFYVERISTDISGKVFELAKIIVRGDRCKYTVDVRDNSFSFTHSIDDLRT